MARGANAKLEVTKKIQEAFGNDYIAEVDKKIYVWANDGGAEKVQIAISLTCPKVEVSVVAAVPTVSHGGWDFEAAAPAQAVAIPQSEPMEITEEEQNNLAELLARLGL